MAKFLNTSATNYFLEEIIKTAKDRLVLISPFLRLNERIKEGVEWGRALSERGELVKSWFDAGALPRNSHDLERAARTAIEALAAGTAQRLGIDIDPAKIARSASCSRWR